MTAPPVLVGEAAPGVLEEEEAEKGVDVAEAEVVTMLLLELGDGVAVTAFTRMRVLVMVVVEVEVSSAATNCAAARHKKEVTRAPICMIANLEVFQDMWGRV